MKTSNSSIAIVSGGHSSNKGASNIDDGLTIDLSLLNEVTLADTKEAVHLGPGAIWSDVYQELETYSLTVAGGRVGHVGVGGYVLGGGFSWYANQVGWTCDAVLEFQVVTPDGVILTVNEHHHGDLLWALKGSLGAFGIVTRIKMETIKTSGFYGGVVSYDEEALPAVFAALQELMRNSEMNPSTTGYLSLGYNASSQDWVYNAYLINTALDTHSPTIGNFLRIPNRGHNIRRMSPRESADEMAESNPLRLRRAKLTLTVLPTFEVMQGILQLVQESTESFRAGEDAFLGVTYQPLTVQHLDQHDNVFNESLTTAYGPLLLISVEMWWKDPSRDKYLEEDLWDLWDVMEWGFAMGRALHTWVYPNYAAAWQEPFVEWRVGNQTLERLKSVSEKYDPEEVWEKLVPGIWHV